MNSACIPNPLLTLLSNGGGKSASHHHHPIISTTDRLFLQPSSPSDLRYEGRFSLLDSRTPNTANSPNDDETRNNLSVSVSVTSLPPESHSSSLSSSSLDQLQAICRKNAPSSSISLDERVTIDQDQSAFTCHLCPYTSSSRDDFNSHVNCHYDFRCPRCEFASRDEDEHRSHLRSAHDLTPEDIEDVEQGVRVPKVNSQGKVKKFKCKQCDFISVTKKDFWQHTKSHIKPDKMLQCPKCPFVTEYRHHMEYHVRNHFGSKPFSCPSCSYSCVNKSMLNSHMKSHTTVYQYRCQDCTYVTKYCHSLKLHLRKYDHRPAVVLNADGTPNPLPIIDVYGTRRGPKMKKEDGLPLLPPHIIAQMQQSSLSNPSSLSHSREASPEQQSPLSASYFQRSLYFNSLLPQPNQTMEEQRKLKCNFCDFETVIPDIYENHILLHNIKEHKSPSSTESSATDSEDKSRRAESSSSTPAATLNYFEFLKKQVALMGSQNPTIQSPEWSDHEPASPTTISPWGSSEMLSRFYLESFISRFKQVSTPESDVSALDLSQTTEDSEVNTANDLKAIDNDPEAAALTDNSSGSKSRRKGKAFRIKQKACQDDGDEDSLSRTDDVPLSGNYICHHCDIAFSSSVMHASHARFHDDSSRNPFKCSACAFVSDDKVAFFVHITKEPHF